jgi:nucleoside-triphosphatase THEP1
VTHAAVALLTGPVGVGKTTVAGQVATLAAGRGYRVGGLLAPAILGPSGQKVGIWGVAVRRGERRMLAHTDVPLEGPHVGPYAFDAAALAWANAVLARDLPWADLLLVDEIGKLELWQAEGLAAILPPEGHPQGGLAAARRALVVVRDSLLPALCARLAGLALTTFAVTPENRDHLAPTEIAPWLAEPPARTSPG